MLHKVIINHMHLQFCTCLWDRQELSLRPGSSRQARLSAAELVIHHALTLLKGQVPFRSLVQIHCAYFSHRATYSVTVWSNADQNCHHLHRIVSSAKDRVRLNSYINPSMFRSAVSLTYGGDIPERAALIQTLQKLSPNSAPILDLDNSPLHFPAQIKGQLNSFHASSLIARICF
ncbi:hypothetical protein RRG08_046884 [Elysia crispata]|uniref:Uncharacterized protein n=1 Tax=Elysia crispata TaxID=231223 RepID=A0AAE0ZHZ8_9GAST|nr:hypothetical protein RRG08_046884 [Elysia crispata]